jgi:hypothetical protein
MIAKWFMGAKPKYPDRTSKGFTVAIFVPVRYKWKGILSGAAFDILFSELPAFRHGNSR